MHSHTTSVRNAQNSLQIKGKNTHTHTHTQGCLSVTMLCHGTQVNKLIKYETPRPL